MGLTLNYIMPNGDVINNAYLRIQKIMTSNQDYEFFEKSEKENVESELKWITRFESDATVYVWTDEQARLNRVQPIHWFTVKFDFDANSTDNIYHQVYTQIGQKFNNV